MCEYSDIGNGQCKVSKDICPYLYFCNKRQVYKENSAMPSNCKVKQNLEIPKGYYKVHFERRGNLYVSVNGIVEIIPNPYDFVPVYVKMNKLKNGAWKIKDAK